MSQTTVIDLRENNMILLQGIPGAGKSTFIRENRLEPYTLSLDTVRMMYGTFVNGDQTNGVIFRTFEALLLERLRHGQSLVIDNTNCKNRDVQKWLRLAPDYGYTGLVIRFDVAPEVALTRQADRGYKAVPEACVLKMYESLQRCTNAYLLSEQVTFTGNISDLSAQGFLSRAKASAPC